MSPAPPKPDNWRRDWPMLAGLAVSASLVFASTVVGAPSDDGPAARPAAKSTAATGAPAAAPAAEAPAADAPTTAAPRPAKRAKRAKKAKVAKAAKATTNDSAGATPVATTTAPKKQASAPKPRTTKPDTPLILSVKGTSGVGRHAGAEVVFTATGHAPAMGSLFTITLAGTKDGKPLSGKVRVDVLHKGEVVGHIHTGKLAGGKYRHSIRWPKESVGQPLVLKTTVDVGAKSQTFLFDVRVEPAG